MGDASPSPLPLKLSFYFHGSYHLGQLCGYSLSDVEFSCSLIICPYKVTHYFFIKVHKVSPLALEFRNPLGVRVSTDFLVNPA